MKLYRAIVRRLLLIMISGVALLSLRLLAQGGLPALPVDQMDQSLIFVGEQVSARITVEQPAQFYLFPALEGETIALSMWREEGDLVPYLRLWSQHGQVLAEQVAQDLAGRQADLQYEVSADETGWYTVEAGYDPASESFGSFSLTLHGTSPTLYDFLGDALPAQQAAQIYLTRGTGAAVHVDETKTFAIFIDRDETLYVQALTELSMPDLVLENLQGQVLARAATGSLSFSSEMALWTVLSVADEMTLKVELRSPAVHETPLAAYRLQDLLTLTPTPTATNTLTATLTQTPTATSTAPPSLTPTATQSSCPGALPPRLRAGDLGRVTPGLPNRLRSQPSVNASIIDRIQGGHGFTVLEGPVCADNYAWFRVDYGSTIGWTAEANSREYWLEPVQ